MKKIILFITITLSTMPLFAQENWIKYNGNPVLSKSDILPYWDYFAAADPCVLKDGDTLKMLYTGIDTYPIPEWPEPYF